MQNLNGRVAVITGAASGVGKQLALRLAREGVKVALADIEQGALDEAVAEVRKAGGTAFGHVTDVSQRAAVDGLRDAVLAEYGKVHLVFNNAGVGGGGGPTIWETSEDAFRWAMDVNYFGPLNGILSFMPVLIEQGEEALMTSTSSGAGIVFPPSGAAYSSSKAALIALMEVLAYQLQMAGSKVKAAILFPGPHVVDTRLFSSHRNVQERYGDPSLRAGGGINNVDEFQAAMRHLIGHEVPLTQPEDFAEEVYASILRDDFYILPLEERTKNAIRKRYEDMLERRQPAIPDMM
ncbi:SDR family NAD(P)-dependent oxidoreductase [Flavisphingomonas formosensis]|uniref:SDR family NAD(P)-dependent oxidoreductase n=1 Tax=Flavisphingomonas formosensis TaxID=861534 RepID=UPI0012FCE825|nr:SDR family NAD(P)-dependent oxidoreductase [Sphingomonas formosensis]